MIYCACRNKGCLHLLKIRMLPRQTQQAVLTLLLLQLTYCNILGAAKVDSVLCNGAAWPSQLGPKS